ncbi:MAG: hypothetical protein PHT62_03335 [Desulfotomaculaceae bacterium]|nr:hypothetical protein [Desulfotomaculaceae bacterium]
MKARKAIVIILAVCLMLALAATTAFAADSNNPPSGKITKLPAISATGAQDYSILWYDMGMHPTTLDMLGYSYTKVTPEDFDPAMLQYYDVFYVGWTEGASSYAMQTLYENREAIADYVKNGGGLVALANRSYTGYEWQWVPLIPEYTIKDADDVLITDASHPVMQYLTSESLSYWGNSYHTPFTTVQSDVYSTPEILTTDYEGLALNVVYEYGEGRMLYSAMDVDYHVEYGVTAAIQLLRNMLDWAAGEGGATPIDTVPPVVNSITFEPATVATGGEVTAIIDASDNDSGVDEIYVEVTNMDSGYCYDSYAEYNDTTGKWEALFYPSEPGTYYLSNLDVSDHMGNYAEYYDNDFPDTEFEVLSAGVTLFIQPDYTEALINDTIALDIRVNNATDLYGADICIYFNDLVLEPIDIDLVEPGIQAADLSDGVLTGLSTINEANGNQIRFATALANPAPGFYGEGKLATLYFRAIAVGASDVSIEYNSSLVNHEVEGVCYDTSNGFVDVEQSAKIINGYVYLEGVCDWVHDISGTSVSLPQYGLQTTTDEDGYFEFQLAEMPAGPVSLSAGRPIYLSYLESVMPDENGNAWVEITLLTGDINENNSVDLPDLDRMADSYGLWYGEPGFDVNADLNWNEYVEVFDLVWMARNWDKNGGTTSYMVSGTVVDQDWNPIYGAEIYVYDYYTEMFVCEIYAEGGYFETILPPGIYMFEAYASGYMMGTLGPVDVYDSMSGLEIMLESSTVPYATIAGMVTDTSGLGLPGAIITIDGGEQTNGIFRSGSVEADGSFYIDQVNTEFDGSPIAKYTIKASKPGYVPGIVVLEGDNALIEGETRTIDFELTPAVTGEYIFEDDFEESDAWTTTGFWHRQNNDASIVNALVPTYVILPPDDTTNAYVPFAFSGNYDYWYGQASAGNFIGEQVVDDNEKSGGTSIASNSGNLTSPTITLPSVSEDSAIMMDFYSWWEIESVNPNAGGFDLMTVQVSADGGSTFTDLGRLNPYADPYEPERNSLAFTSAGFNKAAIWIPYYVDLTDYAGQNINIRFDFNTKDELYNGFRGWFVDDVKVYTTGSAYAGGGGGSSAVSNTINGNIKPASGR